MSSELNDIRSAMDHLSNEKAGQEKLNKIWQGQLGDLQAKYEEAARTLQELDGSKKKLAIENSELSRQLEDADTQISTLNKLKISLAQQLEDVKRVADEESRERAVLLAKFRTVEHDQDGLREQLDGEAEGKADLVRQLSKANAEGGWINLRKYIRLQNL